MSRYALAKRAGVDWSWLRRFEQGRSGVRVETLISIAQGLQMPAAHIVDLMEMALCGPDACPESGAEPCADPRLKRERRQCRDAASCKGAGLP